MVERIHSVRLWFCGAFLLALASSMASETVPSEVVEAAENGLQPFLQWIPAESVESYGFRPGDCLENARLGKPFRLHTITPTALRSYIPGAPVDSILSQTEIWYFPIILNGQAKAVLVVDKMGGHWKAVALGYAGLAGELASIREQWPESEGYNPMLVVVFQAKQFFFTLPEHDSPNLTPIVPCRKTDGRIAVKSDLTAKEGKSKYSALNRLSDVVERLKPMVEESVRDIQP